MKPFNPSSILITTLFFLLVASLLLSVTWPIGTNWGSFDTHARLIFPAIWDLFRDDHTKWHSYWGRVQYAGLQLDFILHSSIPLILSAVLSVIFFRTVYLSEIPHPESRYLSGPRLYIGHQAYRHATKQFKRDRDSREDVGIRVHPKIPITMRAETGNLKLAGQQGTGKSVIQTGILGQIVERGDKLLIFDEKPEYTQLLFDEKSAALISPADARSNTWDISADADTPERAQLVAGQLVHTDTEDPLWTNGARLLLVGCICTLNATRGKNWGWPELFETLTWPRDVLINHLSKYYPLATALIREDNKTTDGFVMSLVARLGWLETLARLWPDRTHKPFSVRDWVNSDGPLRTIIIPNRAEFKAISEPMCATFLCLMSAHVLSLPDSRTRRIWFVLDEFASVPKCPAIHDWLAKGRSKGARTIAGFQNHSQIVEIHGQQMAETIFSLFTNVVSLRCGATGDSAERIAAGFGRRQVERQVKTINSQGEQSISFQQQEELLVRAEDLAHLPKSDREGVEGYLCLGGTNSVYRIKWPYPRTQAIAQEFVPSSLLTAKKNPSENRRRKRKS